MDKVLKQRLVGASILIALAVIFLPMLFDGDSGETGDQRELALDLPNQPAEERRIRRLALDPDEARRPESDTGRAEPPVEQTVPEPMPEPPTSTESSESSVGESDDAGERRADQGPAEAEPVEPAADADDSAEGAPDPDAGPAAPEEPVEPEPEPAAERETPTADLDDSWSVQVAVFSNRDTAMSISERLGDLGHRVSMDELVRDQAELFRLRTGPYASRGEAEQARGQIDATVAGVNPELRAPDDEEGAVESRRGLSAQVGSFASRNNAERLSGQLRAAGFDAFMHAEDSGGRTIWRVRVGIFDEREEAERMLERLREEEGLDGIVVSHP